MEAQSTRTGVWIVGAFGSLATTVMVGARAIARGLARPAALVSEDPSFRQLGLRSLDALEFGGHEIRRDSVVDAAAAITRENGSLRVSWLAELREDLEAITTRIRPGVAVGGGSAVEDLADGFARSEDRTARACVHRLTEDIRSFQRKLRLDRVVVVNLASTEPAQPPSRAPESVTALEKALDAPLGEALRPGTLYACAAIDAGAAYLNFTASQSCLCPAIQELALLRRVPFMGNDGKTGETLVKSGLAPLFRLRRLEVMSWVGYNVLGNRDGRVLATEENKLSKLGTKDSVVPSILGYPLRTHVGIDFVESLGDNKVAWDYIHFRGFLDHPMSMQFTWHGCDSILAAPLVLDLARFAELAMRRGEAGPMAHLASFFKNPIACEDQDLYRQFELLVDYAARTSGAGRSQPVPSGTRETKRARRARN
jgi:myo-inositol-1-phosphate synthase